MMVIDRLRTVSGRDEVIAMVAVCAGVCGGMAVLPVPPVLRAVPLIAFMLVGVGSAVMCWVDMPPAPSIAAVLGVSIASMMAFSVVMAWLQFWHPLLFVLGIGGIVTGSGLLRLRALGHPIVGGSRSW